MALPSIGIDWDMVNTSVMPLLMRQLTDNYFIGDPAMIRLQSRIKQRQLPRTFVCRLGFAPEGGGGEWYAGTDTHDTTIRSPITAATFGVAKSIVSMAIDEQEELEATTPEAVNDLLADKATIAENTARDLHLIALFSAGSNPRAVTGLQAALPTSATPNIASQTYGGITCGGTTIAADEFGWWQPNVDGSATGGTAWVAGSGGTFMFAGAANPMSAMFGRIGARTNREPSVIISPWASWTDFHNSLAKMESYFRPQQNSELAKAGFRNLMYRNAPWIPDARCPRDASNIETVYVLDEEAVTLYWDSRRHFYHEPWRKPYNQSTRVAYIKNWWQFTMRERRTSGAMRVDCTNVF